MTDRAVKDKSGRKLGRERKIEYMLEFYKTR
jgi:hypothetical protein